MLCPSCATEMIEKEYAGVSIDICAGCEGVWTDKGELGKIVSNKEEEFDPDKVIETFKNRWTPRETSSDKVCPQCHQKMKEFNYADTGIMLDRCVNGHGIWLDSDELEKVQIVMEEYDRRFSGVASVGSVSIETVRRCPRCERLLHEIDFEGEQIDVCGSCRGVWLDSGELQQVLRKREEQFSKEKTDSVVVDEAHLVPEHELLPELPCVLCKELMDRSNYSYSSGIIIDSCPHNHGIWLDEDELEKLQILVEKGAEGLDELAGKFQGKLQAIKAECQKKDDEMIRSIKPSRFGFVNRFMQGLARRDMF